MVLKSVLETCLYPSAKLGKSGLCEPWGLEVDAKETCCPGRESKSSAARAGSRFAAGSLPDGQWPQGQEACPCQQAPSPPEQKKIGEVPWLWGHCAF